MSQKALSILLLFNLVFGIPSFAEDEQGPNPVYKRGATILEQTLPPSGITLRDHYTGCEDLSPDFSLPYADHAARFYAPTIHRWMVPDPKSEEYYGVSVYSYCAGNPLAATDKNGKWLETAWDVANVVMDVKSFVDNVKDGNVLGAVVDGVATVVDVAGAMLPLVPSGVGAILKGARASKTATGAISAFTKSLNVVGDAKSLSSFEKASDFGIGSYNTLK